MKSCCPSNLDPTPHPPQPSRASCIACTFTSSSSPPTQEQEDDLLEEVWRGASLDNSARG
eukprot:761994-Hanusia_phi.AAC.4